MSEILPYSPRFKTGYSVSHLSDTDNYGRKVIIGTYKQLMGLNIIKSFSDSPAEDESFDESKLGRTTYITYDIGSTLTGWIWGYKLIPYCSNANRGKLILNTNINSILDYGILSKRGILDISALMKLISIE